MASEPRRVATIKRLTAAQKGRDRAVRAQFANHPGPDELGADFGPFMKQGQQLALMEFAASIKKLREQQKVSLAEMASRTGIDRAAISRIENAQVDNPTIATLERLARSLGRRLRIELVNQPRPKSKPRK
jgi:DNA-binding Xre family transcriptional regulator